jgi:cytochrome c peroxidase
MFTIKTTAKWMSGSIAFLVMLPVIVSCESEIREPEEETIVFVQPVGFPEATYTFENNPVTTGGFTLGRMLFYDPVLSSDSTVSCSTCHRQVTGFADPTHRINHGVGNRFGKRNSPSITNMAFRGSFFFDGGASHLDFVPINAITNAAEMDNTLEEVVHRLQQQERYRKAFQIAFGEGEINSQRLLKALAQFNVMLTSAHARYDQMKRGESNFNAIENEGYLLFQQKCVTCHATEIFTDGSYRNNGLDEAFEDQGRKIVTGLNEDAGKFKVPSLRNIAVTPPYMHDGRFNDLEQVLNHYAQGVKVSETLDPFLIQDESAGISLTDDEQYKIIAFLNTLTDQQLLTDKRFSNPF